MDLIDITAHSDNVHLYYRFYGETEMKKTVTMFSLLATTLFATSCDTPEDRRILDEINSKAKYSKTEIYVPDASTRKVTEYENLTLINKKELVKQGYNVSSFKENIAASGGDTVNAPKGHVAQSRPGNAGMLGLMMHLKDANTGLRGYPVRVYDFTDSLIEQGKTIVQMKEANDPLKEKIKKASASLAKAELN